MQDLRSIKLQTKLKSKIRLGLAHGLFTSIRSKLNSKVIWYHVNMKKQKKKLPNEKTFQWFWVLSSKFVNVNY